MTASQRDQINFERSRKSEEPEKIEDEEPFVNQAASIMGEKQVYSSVKVEVEMPIISPFEEIKNTVEDIKKIAT